MSEFPHILYIDMVPGEPSQRLKLAGIQRYATLRGWDVVCVPRAELRETDVRSVLARYRPVGVVVEGAARKTICPPGRFGSIPVAYIEYPAAEVSGKAPNVTIDEDAVADVSFRELSAGRPAAYVAVGHANPHLWSRLRVRAFRRRCARDGARCSVFPSRWGEPGDRHEARLAAWLAALPRPAAVFAASNAAAAAVTRAARAVPLHIPKEMSLIAFGNFPEICENASTPITSIQFDFERMGYLAAKALDANRRSTQASREGDAVVGPLLVVRRKSTSGRGRHEPWILKAVEIIRAEACGGLTIDNLVQRLESGDGAPVSRRNFDRRFREAMGHTAQDEILHVRLESACALLAQTNTPIMAIPDFCGFGCYRALDAHFRSRFKMSMKKWRDANAY